LGLYGGGVLVAGRDAYSGGQSTTLHTFTPNTYNKIVTTLNSSIASGSVNGSVDSNITLTSNVPYYSFYLGRALPSDTWILNGWIKKIAYYPVAFSNTQIQTLTAP